MHCLNFNVINAYVAYLLPNLKKKRSLGICYGNRSKLENFELMQRISEFLYRIRQWKTQYMDIFLYIYGVCWLSFVSVFPSNIFISGNNIYLKVCFFLILLDHACLRYFSLANSPIAFICTICIFSIHIYNSNSNSNSFLDFW